MVLVGIQAGAQIAGNINKPMLGMLETLEPTLVQKALASASSSDARKAAVAAIERLHI
jgi:hypothetical protein